MQPPKPRRRRGKTKVLNAVESKCYFAESHSSHQHAFAGQVSTDSSNPGLIPAHTIISNDQGQATILSRSKQAAMINKGQGLSTSGIQNPGG